MSGFGSASSHLSYFQFISRIFLLPSLLWLPHSACILFLENPKKDRSLESKENCLQLAIYFSLAQNFLYGYTIFSCFRKIIDGLTQIYGLQVLASTFWEAQLQLILFIKSSVGHFLALGVWLLFQAFILPFTFFVDYFQY